MKTKITLQKSIFKHTGQWHLIPAPKIVIEPFPRIKRTAVTFEITFLPFTAYLTIWVKFLNDRNDP